MEVHNRMNLGRLKAIVMQAVGAEGEYSLYSVPAAGGDMVFLTRDVFTALSNNDKIHLAEGKPAPATA